MKKKNRDIPSQKVFFGKPFKRRGNVLTSTDPRPTSTNINPTLKSRLVMSGVGLRVSKNFVHSEVGHRTSRAEKIRCLGYNLPSLFLVLSCQWG
jgi:hypothetical protein